MLIAIAFYLLAFTAIAAGFMVVASRNPVHSVMFLIMTFFAAAGLFILMGAEFICAHEDKDCLLYTSPSPRDLSTSRMPSSA